MVQSEFNFFHNDNVLQRLNKIIKFIQCILQVEKCLTLSVLDFFLSQEDLWTLLLKHCGEICTIRTIQLTPVYWWCFIKADTVLLRRSFMLHICLKLLCRVRFFMCNDKCSLSLRLNVFIYKHTRFDVAILCTLIEGKKPYRSRFYMAEDWWAYPQFVSQYTRLYWHKSARPSKRQYHCPDLNVTEICE